MDDMQKGHITVSLVWALGLLALAGCSTLQYEGGVNKQSTAPDYRDRGGQPPPAEKPTFRF